MAEQMLDNAMLKGFVSDAFTDGRRFRVLAIEDDFSRECLAPVVDTSFSDQEEPFASRF